MRRTSPALLLGALLLLLAACGDEKPVSGPPTAWAPPSADARAYDLEGNAREPLAPRPASLPRAALVLLDAAPPGSPADAALRDLAREGLLFESAVAASPDAWPSLSSVLTSLPPGAHAVQRDGVAPVGHARMWTTGAEVFGRALGLGTLAVVPAAWPTHAEPLLQGFQTVLRGDDAAATLNAWMSASRLATTHWLVVCVLPPGAAAGPALAALRRTLDGLGGGGPWLLAAAALRARTLEPTSPSTAALAPETLRSPLALLTPAGTRGVRRGTLGLIDLMPTLLALAGAPPLPDAGGASFAPLLEADGPGRPSACEWLGAGRRRVLGVHDGPLVYGVVHDVVAGTVLEHLFEGGRELADAEGRLPDRTFDPAFAAAVERARDRIWAGVRESNTLAGGGYDTQAGVVTSPRPPPPRTQPR